MLKKGFAALVGLAVMSALASWGATVYQVQTKLSNVGGTIKVRSNALQTTAGSVVYSNFTTSAPIPVTVSALSGYKISSITKSGVVLSVPDPATFTTSFVKSGGTTQSLLATFVSQLVSVTGTVTGSGTLTPGSASVPSGTTAYFQATPTFTNSYLTGVTGGTVTDTAGNPVSYPFSGTVKIAVSNVTTPRQITVTFATASANAGGSQTVKTHAQATLNGSLSGGGTSFWSLLSGPAPVTLSDATALNPSFTPNLAGVYSFQLTQYLNGIPVATGITQVTVVDSLTDNMKSSCMGCHGASGTVPAPAVFTTWSSSTHKVSGVTCVTCHTSGAMPTPANTVSVNSTNFVINAASAGTVGTNYCATCHSPQIPADFASSPHKAKGLTCTSCHIQGVHDPVVATAVCDTCHFDLNGNVANHPFAINGAACTTCHNPHSTVGTLPTQATSAHFNNITGGMYPASYVTSRAACTDCHATTPNNQTIRQQWAASAHAATTELPWIDYDFKTRAGCVQCHTTTGFIAFSTARVTAAWGVASDKTKEVLTCVGCHSDISAGTVRTVIPVKPYADETSFQNHNVGVSNLCMDCHSGRNNGASIQVKVASADFGNLAYIAPHYLSAGGSLQAKSGYHFPGRSYAGYSSNSHSKIGMANASGTGTDGACVACHMSASAKHAFSPVTVDQSGAVTAITTALCANCHGSTLPAATLDAERLAFNNALNILKAELEVKGFTYSANYPYFVATNWGSGQNGANVMGAAFNYKLFLAEPGAYAHNPAYAQQLIVDSIDAAYNDGTVTGDIGPALNALYGDGKITLEMRNSMNAYKQAEKNCNSCHGNPPASGIHLAQSVAPGTCANCHVWTGPGSATHINGTVDMNMTCTSCHGYPPAALTVAISGHTGTHTTATDCATCHGANPGAPGHNNGILATTCDTCHGNPPTSQTIHTTGAAKYTHSTPAVVYTDCTVCHDSTHRNGTVDLITNDNACSSCHSYPPTSAAHATASGGTSPNCTTCHTYTGYSASSHNNGTLDISGDLACDTCHGYPPLPAAVLAARANGEFANAKLEDYAKGGGYHASHLAATITVADGFTPCLPCHPSTSHRQGASVLQANINIFDPADISFRLNSGLPKSYDRVATTCSNVSCHYQASPAWQN